MRRILDQPVKPPRPIKTSSPRPAGGGKALSKITYSAATGRRVVTPPSSTGARLSTPTRGESGHPFQAGATSSATTSRSPLADTSAEQQQRQEQLETLLNLPSRFTRVGGGYERVPYAAEELLNAAVIAVTRERGSALASLDEEKAELSEALGIAIAEADHLRASLSNQPVIEEMKMRVEQAHKDAEHFERNIASVKLEANAAKRAASDARRLQSDLLQVQRQLASWVVTAVEESRRQRLEVREAEERGVRAATSLRDSLGGQLRQAHHALAAATQAAGGAGGAPAPLPEDRPMAAQPDATMELRLKEQQQYADSLLESLSFFAESRTSVRSLVAALRKWQTIAAERSRSAAAARVAPTVEQARALGVLHERVSQLGLQKELQLVGIGHHHAHSTARGFHTWLAGVLDSALMQQSSTLQLA